MRGLCLVFGLLACLAFGAAAQDRKGIRFWNLTLNTVTKLQLAPAGTDAWGSDQCQNDRDGTVDHDERLRITGVEPGHYDIRLADTTGRLCVVKNIEVKAGGIFTIEEKQLIDCAS
jgi:hypothetical protein